jgi:hypothetical protein
MPLTWNVSEVDFYKDDLDSIWMKRDDGWGEYDDVVPELKALIFGSAAVAIGHLTEKTAPDFYARWKFLEKVDGLYVTAQMGEDGLWNNQYITPYIVKKHIGLATNVSTRSNAEWVKNILRNDKSIKYSSPEVKAMLTVSALEYKESMSDQ